MAKASWGIPLGALLALASVGCGAPPNVTVKVGSVASAVNASKTKRSRVPRSAQGDSHLAPAVTKMKISLVDGIDLCTGVYGTATDDCSARVVTLASPVEVELSNQGDTDVNLGALGTVQAVPAGTYTHARLRVASAYSVLAAFHSGNDTYYTTPEGLKVHEGSPISGDDLGYLPMADLYPNLPDDPHGMQETTYFSTPLEHDGTSPLEVKLLVDIVRSGRFSTGGADAVFVPAYPNYYVTFNAMGAAAVETYGFGTSEVESQMPYAPLMTLLLTSSGELLGGRTRFAEGLGQFVKDFSCDADRVCSFKLGDWGTGVFPHSVSGFDRLAVDEVASFDISDDQGNSATLFANRLNYP